MNATRTASRAAWARRRASAAAGWTQFRSNKAGLSGMIVLLIVVALALLAPVLAPESTLDVTRLDSLQNEPPSLANPLGTDPSGRSVLAMLLWGARVSLVVGFAATAVSMVIGTVVGMAAGHFSGAIQAVLMRIIDFFLVVPSLVLAIVLSSILGAGVITIVAAIGITSWASTARLVRAQTLTIESRPYIDRSWALGAGDAHIIGRHVLPAVLPLVLANTTLTVGSAIIAESTLSFLGLGDSTSISWGTMLKSALDTGAATAGFWWFVLPPGVAIVIVVLCFTLVGRALESVVNPTLRGR
ncbi:MULTISPECIES: ABC transporter permease [Arthrobacter]|uniref:ABC transporter permease n=1 Tax=Arthrobacter caoxuetaonis TaxID=2886935 RepID=A0A9X1SBY3_9MICC|nr:MULTISPECIES: ABC transporter permease [Arthrobacter]MCC3282063.1 ABC transporter permease [Arthrobacter caoxuetaonis]MCC3297553.1 ABC transporter permease [Arthrobacter caoxuetaonis]MCC9194448.1 ABC transporter permease [Arthrobacter sp. zg-Y916]USQ57917.1 ABC transporter permease [Arthrobacter caoxuetaonis]